ncbi:MAG: hypothetical protein JWM53_332 [bacterium]|nr:hypothetical protein [bacterium]
MTRLPRLRMAGVAQGADVRGGTRVAWVARMSRVFVILGMLAAAACSGPNVCKPMSCATPCGAVGYKLDASGCRVSCECNGTPTSCPAISCTQSCGLGTAQDQTTGCPTCTCCYPADCQPGGCNSTGDDGCPTCVAC